MQAAKTLAKLSSNALVMPAAFRLPSSSLGILACRRWSKRLPCTDIQPRFCSSDVLPPAAIEGENKHFAPKIQKLVDDISQLTLMEVADLNELLKKTLNIADAPVMAMGSMPMQASQEKEEEEEQAEAPVQQVAFTVRLAGFEDSKKVMLIKELKAQMTGMNLVQAKKFVESTPQNVKTDVSKEEAQKLKELLEAAGGKVEVE